MTLRDSLLPVAELANKLGQQFGLARFSVTLRRRIWDGDRVGAGNPTVQDIVLTPPPPVTFKPPFARQMEALFTSGGKISDRYYQVDNIIPAYTKSDGTSGGYTPNQLRMSVGPDMKSVECVVILIGDDGRLRECSQITFDDSDAFAYSMLLQEKDRPSVKMLGIAISPAPAALKRPKKLQLAAAATFSDEQTYDVSAVVQWTVADQTIATVDVLGNVTGAAAGSTQIFASIGAIQASPVTLTVT